jgi:hypothetical protein
MMQSLYRSALFLFAASLCGVAAAQPATFEPATTAEPLTETEVIERVTKSLDRSMEYLRAQQRPDGGWHNNHAVNGLALLAFMGRGHVPGRGPYQDVLERGKTFLLANSNKETGFLAYGTMYEHGLATLAMAEMYGMDPDPELEEALRKAVDLIIRCQSPAGGWRYSPTPTDQDLSVSVMQIVALPQTSAAGLLSLQLLGHYDDPTIGPTLTYVESIPIDWTNQSGVSYFYYFHYYAMQAQYQAGGKHWNNWHPRIRELLLSKQNEDGSWDVPPGTAEAEGTVGPNKIYWTAMASLVLDVYLHFLPAYQR